MDWDQQGFYRVNVARVKGFRLAYLRVIHFETCRFNLRSFARVLLLFFSLRSKRFQSTYCTKVRAGAKKKKVEGGGEGEKRQRFPANPTILENAPCYFTVGFICKLTARQNRNITNRLPLDYQICKITLQVL